MLQQLTLEKVIWVGKVTSEHNMVKVMSKWKLDGLQILKNILPFGILLTEDAKLTE